jgi:exopolyphosphatase/guanosine-5'-triphosphate,3'-diphosphate pyrophosphatase
MIVSRRLPIARPDRVAVVDVGSTTTTLAVYDGGPPGFVREVDRRSRALGLARSMACGRELPSQAVADTAEAVRAFAKRARRHDVEDLRVVGTSAVRDAENRDDLVEAVREETGLALEILAGPDEGRAATLAALEALPVSDGVLVDLGGGSLQIVRFRGRRVTNVASLDLGALRLASAFFSSDPPSGIELVDLRRHVERALRTVSWLGEREPVVVGTGGTIRALARLERRRVSWPIAHVHGFELGGDHVLDVVDVLSRMPRARRSRVPGLPPHRVDAVVAGAVVVNVLFRATQRREILVSTFGLREGIALGALHGGCVTRDPRRAGLHGCFPDPRGAASRARGRVLRECGSELDPIEREGLGLAAWVTASGADPERLLDVPVQGYTQAEILVAARSLGLVDDAATDVSGHLALAG